MTVISAIFCLTSSVANFQNGPSTSSLSKFDDDTLSDLIETLKKAEADNKEMNKKRVAFFHKGVQQASVSSNGTFAFPPKCTPTSQIEGYAYCFHGSLQEQNKSTDDTTKKTEVHAAADFFDIFNPNESTAIGLTAVYEDKEVQKLDVEAGGVAELLSFGNKSTVAASTFLATHVEELYEPGQLGIMRNSFVATPHFIVYAYGYLVMNMESVPVQASDVFAGKSFNLGFNMSASYERGISYGSVGAKVELSLRSVKNDVRKWNLLGRAEAFVRSPVGTVRFPYDYFSESISV